MSDKQHMDAKRLEKLAATDTNAARELARLRFRASGNCGAVCYHGIRPLDTEVPF